MTTIPVQSTGPSQHVAAEVRALLARRGVSLRAFAEQLDVPPHWAHRRLSAGRTVDLTLEDVERIARALDVTAADLYGA